MDILDSYFFFIKTTKNLDETVRDILGGVRSTCTYIGAKKIKDISKCTTFVCVNNQLNNIFN